MSDKEKKCTMCGLSKPNTREYFHIRTRKDGTQVTVAYCKKCTKKIKSSNTIKRDKTNKVCKKCERIFPNTGKYFYKQKVKGKYYTRPICIECSKNEQITYYDKNRPHILDHKKEYYKGLQESKSSLQ